MPMQWYDEHAFIPHVSIVYLSATPAFKTASMNAARNGAPYGILITTTPGDLTTDSGMDSFLVKEHATPFVEEMYDMSYPQLCELLAENTDSTFIYIRFTWQQLGRDEQWFKEMCIDLQKNWSAIRREVELEWAKASDNSPFSKEDLNKVQGLLKKPIRETMILGKYHFKFYGNIDPRYPCIMGVDVAGGYKRDFSAITIIDSKTTEVKATFKCNYISTPNLAFLIQHVVNNFIPNCIINIERNGGFGGSVLAKLVTSNIRRNLYWELKDRVVEEKYDNHGHTIKQTQRQQVFGLDNTHSVRETLIDILRQRMDLHKDKFISQDIFEELETLELKRNGRVEHTSNGHDDLIFSYLMALYVWYEGKNLRESFGIIKTSLKTDEMLSETVVTLEEKYDDILPHISMEHNEEVEEQIKILTEVKATQYEEWMAEQDMEEKKAIAKLMNNRATRHVVENQYAGALDSDMLNGQCNLPDEVFTKFYD